jgi:hypothetical protein
MNQETLDILSEGTGADADLLFYLERSYRMGVDHAINICKKERSEEPGNRDRLTVINLIIAQLHDLKQK